MTVIPTEGPPGAPSRSVTQILSRLERHPVPAGHFIVSCYIPLGPDDRTRQHFISALNSRVHELTPTVEALAPSHDVREAVKRDFEALQEFCGQPERLPATRAAALFACGAADLFEVVGLPEVPRFHVVVDRTPYVRPLVAVSESFDRVVTAVVDRARARIFEVTAFDAAEIADLTATAMRGGRYHSDRQDAPGWGEHAYHNRIRTEKERHFSAVAEWLQSYDRQRTVRGFVIAAQGPTATTVARFLPPPLEARLLGTARLNPTAVSPASVAEATIAVSAEHARVREAEMMAQLEEAIGTGWAVDGLRETLAALHKGQVRRLLVRDAAEGSGFRCKASGRFVLTSAECKHQGNAAPAPYLIDDAIEEAYRQRVPVTTVYTEGDAGLVHTMAAFLRFR